MEENIKLREHSKVIDTLLNAIYILFHPSYWLMNDEYSKSWDRELLKLMEEHKFHSYSTHTVKLGDMTIWIANHPCGSFTPYGIDYKEVRPSRSTIAKAYKKMKKDLTS